MQYFVTKNTRSSVLAIAAAVSALASLPSVVSAQTTGVYATLCAGASSVTLAKPINDSTVANPRVELSGTVAQANQIEVYVDDQFDSTIPLTAGQTTYSDTVQLATGTHTVRVEAVNSCGGQNGEATSVVTYTPPPAEGSTGQSASTQVAPSQGGAVSVGQGNGASVEEAGMPLGLPPFLGRPVLHLLEWLNVTDYADSNSSGLSIWRALIVVLGMSLLVLGVWSSLVARLARTAFVKKRTAKATVARRQQLVRWAVHILGFVILLLALFL